MPWQPTFTLLSCLYGLSSRESLSCSFPGLDTLGSLELRKLNPRFKRRQECSRTFLRRGLPQPGQVRRASFSSAFEGEYILFWPNSPWKFKPSRTPAVCGSHSSTSLLQVGSKHCSCPCGYSNPSPCIVQTSKGQPKQPHSLPKKGSQLLLGLLLKGYPISVQLSYA